jgi:hypothetical protein
MRRPIAVLDPGVREHLPPARPDGSGVGVNYVDAYLRTIKAVLDDGRKVTGRRRGLEVCLQVGEHRGRALLRRLEHGPDPVAILAAALQEAAGELGGALHEEEGRLILELPDPGANDGGDPPARPGRRSGPGSSPSTGDPP